MCIALHSYCTCEFVANFIYNEQDLKKKTLKWAEIFQYDFVLTGLKIVLPFAEKDCDTGVLRPGQKWSIFSAKTPNANSHEAKKLADARLGTWHLSRLY